MGLAWSNLFLTGPRGVGKTTILFRALRYCRVRAGGYVVKKVFREGRRVGMDIVDLTTGGRRRLITFIEARGSQVPEVPVWGWSLPVPVVDLGGFVEVGIPAIRSALESRADIVVLDEIGRFEVGVPGFVDMIDEALCSPVPVTGVLKAESNALLDGIRARPDIRLVHVDRAGRNTAETEYRQLLRDLLLRMGRPAMPRTH